jgi:hypothetical protein
MGSVKWISKDIDVKLLDDKIKVNNDENLFEKGLYFVEPFWTTCIIPHLVVKDALVSID